ncbi:FxLYD domain-containing protein, partial [Rhodoplanes roseus]
IRRTLQDAIRAEEAARRAAERQAERREAERREADRREAERREAERRATAEPALAMASAGPDTAKAAAPAPSAAEADDDDGWPADLSPPKETAAAAPETAADTTQDVENAPSVVPESDAFALPDTPARDWDAEFEAAEARRLAREQAGAKPRRRLALPRPSWTTVVLSMLVAIGVVLAWRADVARVLPQTASVFARIGLPVNLRGLAFDAVKLETDTADKVPVVVVEGVIVNVAKVRIDVPRLRFAMRDANGAELHTWTALPQKPALAPGETLAFRTRLASPPAESREILVRFFNRRDR